MIRGVMCNTQRSKIGNILTSPERESGRSKIMSTLRLTEHQTFLAMYSFLEDYYQLTKSDDIGSLLSSMSLLADGRTADPAVEDEWREAVEKVLSGTIDATLALSK